MTDQDAMLVSIRRTALEVTGGDLSGKCAAVALIVQAACGGDLIEGWVTFDRYAGCHYWNRLPDGSEVDLTSCQFGGDGRTPLTAGEPVARPDLIDPLHLSLGAAMYARLAEKLRKRASLAPPPAAG